MASTGGHDPISFEEFSSTSGNVANPNIVHGNYFPYGIWVTFQHGGAAILPGFNIQEWDNSYGVQITNLAPTLFKSTAPITSLGSNTFSGVNNTFSGQEVDIHVSEDIDMTGENLTIAMTDAITMTATDLTATMTGAITMNAAEVTLEASDTLTLHGNTVHYAFNEWDVTVDNYIINASETVVLNAGDSITFDTEVMTGTTTTYDLTAADFVHIEGGDNIALNTQSLTEGVATYSLDANTSITLFTDGVMNLESEGDSTLVVGDTLAITSTNAITMDSEDISLTSTGNLDIYASLPMTIVTGGALSINSGTAAGMSATNSIGLTTNALTLTANDIPAGPGNDPPAVLSQLNLVSDTAITGSTQTMTLVASKTAGFSGSYAPQGQMTLSSNKNMQINGNAITLSAQDIEAGILDLPPFVAASLSLQSETACSTSAKTITLAASNENAGSISATSDKYLSLTGNTVTFTASDIEGGATGSMALLSDTAITSLSQTLAMNALHENAGTMALASDGTLTLESTAITLTGSNADEELSNGSITLSAIDENGTIAITAGDTLNLYCTNDLQIEAVNDLTLTGGYRINLTATALESQPDAAIVLAANDTEGTISLSAGQSITLTAPSIVIDGEVTGDVTSSGTITCQDLTVNEHLDCNTINVGFESGEGSVTLKCFNWELPNAIFAMGDLVIGSDPGTGKGAWGEPDVIVSMLFPEAAGVTLPSDLTFSGSVTIPTGASTGHLLTSDADGTATWAAPDFTALIGNPHTWTGQQTFTQNLIAPQYQTNDANSNVYIGNTLPASNGSRTFNTVLGYGAMPALSGTTTNCVALGHAAFPDLLSGVGNIAIGYGAGAGQTSGNGSTFIGYQAGASGNFSECVALGNFAACDASNQMMLGPSSGMQVVVPTSLQYRANGGATTGYVLQSTDSSGTCAWVDPYAPVTTGIAFTGTWFAGYPGAPINCDYVTTNMYTGSNQTILRGVFTSSQTTENTLTTLNFGNLQETTFPMTTMTTVTSISGANILEILGITLTAALCTTFSFPLLKYIPSGNLTLVLASITTFTLSSLQRVNASLALTLAAATSIDLGALLVVATNYTISAALCTTLTTTSITTIGGSITLTMAALTSASFPALTSMIGSLLVTAASCTSFSMPLLATGMTTLSLTLGAATSIDLGSLVSVSGNTFSITAANCTSLTLTSLVSTPTAIISMNGLKVTTLSLPALTTCVGVTATTNAFVTSANFSSLISIGGGSFNLGSCTNLATFTMSPVGTFKSCTSNFVIVNAALNQASVDAILAVFASLDGTNGTTSFGTGLTLGLNSGTSATPSATGLTNKGIIQARGATVNTN